MDTPCHGFRNTVPGHGFERPVSYFGYSRIVFHKLPDSFPAVVPDGGQLIDAEVPLEGGIGAAISVTCS